MSDEVATRNEKGQFVKGHSGNPAGKPVGTRNQTTLVKEFIEHNLTNELEDEAKEILFVAIRKAKEGDNQMIKFLLGDMLSEVRREAQGAQSGVVEININNMTDEPNAVTIDHEDINEQEE